MASITVTRVQTMSQHSFHRPTRFFYFDDALALEVFVEASDDLASLPRAMFQVVFQIISAQTNTVVFSKPVLGFFEDGPSFWLLLGKNLKLAGGELTHPAAYGLTTNWNEYVTGEGIFGFRALAKALQVQEINRRDFLVPLEDPDCFDISENHWFRIAPGKAPEKNAFVDQVINTGIWPGEPGRSAKDDDYPGGDLPLSRGRFG